MSEELATYGKQQIVNVEEYAMSIDGLLRQVQLIQEVMSKVMKINEHYGVIPGTDKPTLLKPGAEKLCLTFRLDPDYEIIREIRDKDFLAYTVKCILHHIPTKQEIASGIGSCNSKETKYRYRYKEESTGNPVPKEYWKAKQDNDSKEMKRILGEGMRAAKIDGQWVIAKSQKVENDNPWDQDNTIIKMACKRALVAATLNATAASDIFTQDLEDMEEPPIKNKEKPSDKNPEMKEPGEKKEPPEPPPNMKRVITVGNQKHFFSVARVSGKTDDVIKAYLLSLGIEHSADIPYARFEEVCKWAQTKEPEREAGEEG